MGRGRCLIAVLVLLLPACSEGDTASASSAPDPAGDAGAACSTNANAAGERGVLHFHRGDWPFAPGVRLPLMIGIQLGMTLPPMNASTDAPAVAEFLSEGNGLLINAHAPGQARLELLHAETGDLVDASTFSVAHIASIEGDRTDVFIFRGGSSYVGLDTFDDRECAVVARGGGVAYQMVGLAGSTVPPVTGLEVGGTYDEGNGFTVGDPGAGALSMTAASGASLSIPVEVVDETAVAKVTVTGTPGPWKADADRAHGVLARAFAADGREIEDPECVWSLEPPGGAVHFAGLERHTAYVAAATPGTATVRCDIGAAGALDVTFE